MLLFPMFMKYAQEFPARHEHQWLMQAVNVLFALSMLLNFLCLFSSLFWMITCNVQIKLLHNCDICEPKDCETCAITIYRKPNKLDLNTKVASRCGCMCVCVRVGLFYWIINLGASDHLDTIIQPPSCRGHHRHWPSPRLWLSHALAFKTKCHSSSWLFAFPASLLGKGIRRVFICLFYFYLYLLFRFFCYYLCIILIIYHLWRFFIRI